MLAGKEFGRIGELLRGWRALLASGKRRRDTDVGPANPVSLPGAFKNRGDVGGGVCTLIVRKLEVAQRATARGHAWKTSM